MHKVLGFDQGEGASTCFVLPHLGKLATRILRDRASCLLGRIEPRRNVLHLYICNFRRHSVLKAKPSKHVSLSPFDLVVR